MTRRLGLLLITCLSAVGGAVGGLLFLRDDRIPLSPYSSLELIDPSLQDSQRQLGTPLNLADDIPQTDSTADETPEAEVPGTIVLIGSRGEVPLRYGMWDFFSSVKVYRSGESSMRPPHIRWNLPVTDERANEIYEHVETYLDSIGHYQVDGMRDMCAKRDTIRSKEELAQAFIEREVQEHTEQDRLIAVFLAKLSREEADSIVRLADEMRMRQTITTVDYLAYFRDSEANLENHLSRFCSQDLDALYGFDAGQ